LRNEGIQDVIHGATVSFAVIMNFVGEIETCLVDDAEAFLARKVLIVGLVLHHQHCQEIRHAFREAPGISKA
jgi:hypothetical protein